MTKHLAPSSTGNNGLLPDIINPYDRDQASMLVATSKPPEIQQCSQQTDNFKPLSLHRSACQAAQHPPRRAWWCHRSSPTQHISPSKQNQQGNRSTTSDVHYDLYTHSHCHYYAGEGCCIYKKVNISYFKRKLAFNIQYFICIHCILIQRLAQAKRSLLQTT